VHAREGPKPAVRAFVSRSPKMSRQDIPSRHEKPSRTEPEAHMAAAACLIMLAITGLILIMLWEVCS
jgi:hypothetical protein